MEIYRDTYADIYMYTPTYVISTQSFGSTIFFQTKLRVLVGLLLWVGEDKRTKTD